MSTPDDAISDATIRQAVTGDRESQQLIYERLGGRVGALVRRIVGQSAAEDVAQDVFIQVFAKLHTYGAASSFSTWVYRLAVNEALQYLRRERRRTTVDLTDSALVAGKQHQELDTRDLVQVALSRLDDELRVVLELKEMEKLPYEQIAEIVGIPVGTVGSRLNKARREVREHLQRLGWEG